MQNLKYSECHQAMNHAIAQVSYLDDKEPIDYLLPYIA